MRTRAPVPLQVTVHEFLPDDTTLHPSLQVCALCTLPKPNRHHQTSDPSLFIDGSLSHVPTQ